VEGSQQRNEHKELRELNGKKRRVQKPGETSHRPATSFDMETTRDGGEKKEKKEQS